MPRAIVFVICAVALFGVFERPHAAQQSVNLIDDRAPFAIELPEPGLDTGALLAVNHTDIFIPPKQAVTRLRLWVLQPYDQRFGYNIKASLNGKALATVATRGSGRCGNFLDIDLRQQPDLRLTPGRNFVEVTATETESGLTYRCSFVLMLAQGRAPRPEPFKPEIRFEQVLAASDSLAPNDDRTAPQLTLTEPSAPPNGDGAPFGVRLAGSARDESGVVTAVTVNGRIIAQAPPPRADEKRRNKKEKEVQPPSTLERKLDFDHVFTVGSGVCALLLEARDGAGNRALAYIPIVRSAPLASTVFGGRQYAVIVGVSRYAHHEGDLNDLAYADKDAEAMRDWLRTGGGGGFKAEDIVCLTNAQATLGAVRKEITRFLTKAGPNDLIYLFLAGHGAPDRLAPQNLYFLLHDSKVNDLPNTAFPMSELGKFLDEQSKQARLIAFFDTCHSAGVNRKALNPPAAPQSTAPKQASAPRPATIGKDNRGVGSKKSDASGADGPGVNRPPTVALSVSPAAAGFEFYNAELFKQRGWTVITSSSLIEESQESAKWGGGHGVFTWALLKGAKEGEADTNGDCRITAAELFDYVKGSVRRETGGAQTPQVLPGGGDFVVASTPAANCRKAERK